MQIDFINCAFPTKSAIPPPGLLSLAAATQAADVSVRVIDTQVLSDDIDLNPNHILDVIEAPAEMTGFSTMSISLPLAVKTAELLKQRFPHTLILFGGCGVHCACKEILEKFEFIDFVFFGEAEKIFPLFLAQFQKGEKNFTVPGLAFRLNGHIKINPPPDRIHNLDLLALPAYDLVKIKDYPAPISLMTSRGCPFRCAYCDMGALRGQVTISRSAESIIDEIQFITQKFGIIKFNFVDDTFTAIKNRAEQFCRTYVDRGCNFTWGALVQVNTINESLMEKMAQAGCKALYFGVESGSDNVLKAINKGVYAQKAQQTVVAAKKYFEFVTASFIWGFPFESLNDLEQTLLMIAYFQSQSIASQLHLWSPMPQSALFNTYQDQLIFDPGIISDMTATATSINGSEALIKSSKKIFSPFYHVPHPCFEEKKRLIQHMGLLNHVK